MRRSKPKCLAEHNGACRAASAYIISANAIFMRRSKLKCIAKNNGTCRAASAYIISASEIFMRRSATNMPCGKIDDCLPRYLQQLIAAYIIKYTRDVYAKKRNEYAVRKNRRPFAAILVAIQALI